MVQEPVGVGSPEPPSSLEGSLHPELIDGRATSKLAPGENQKQSSQLQKCLPDRKGSVSFAKCWQVLGKQVYGSGEEATQTKGSSQESFTSRSLSILPWVCFLLQFFFSFHKKMRRASRSRPLEARIPLALLMGPS